MKTRRPTAAAGTLSPILDFAEQERPGARALLVQKNGGWQGADPEARVPAEQIPLLLAEASRLIGDPVLGLRLAMRADPKRFGLLSYIFSTSRDLREAYTRAARFLGLWNEGVDLGVVQAAEEAALTLQPRGIRLDRESEGIRQLLELSTATLILVGRLFTGVTFLPLRVEFFTAAPEIRAEHRQCYGDALYFQMPTTRIVLSPAVLALPLRTRDSTLSAILARHAEEILVQLRLAITWRGRVRAAITEGLGQGEVALPLIARRLGISPRTLQRRLREEETAFEAILDEARYELAARYLRDPRLSFSEVAYLLGFAELSAFYHAFKRWAGLTPAEYRKEAS